MLITVFETRPKIVRQTPSGDEGEEPVERVLLDDDGNPCVETINRGVSKYF